MGRDRQAPGRRIAFVGECMIELFHRPGDDEGSLRRTVGGDTLNAAVYCRRALGDRPAAGVHYVTRLGDDPFGHEIPAFIRAQGVETDLVRTIPGETTGLYAISRDAAGERSFSYWRGEAAARRLFAGGGDADIEEALAGFDALFFSGITLAVLREDGRERLLALAKGMKANGRLVAFDGNYRPRLWESKEAAADAIARAHGAATLTLPGFDDETALYGDPSAGAAVERLLAFGATHVVLKRGSEPALVADAGGVDEVPSPRAEKVVDTTAAGDSFDGAALAVLLAGGTLREAVRAGHRMAGLVIGEYGAIVSPEHTHWSAGPPIAS